jgi:hypothetical protein
MGRRETGRSRADDRDTTSAVGFAVEEMGRVSGFVRGEKPFDVANPNPAVIIDFLAMELARMGAHIAQNPWKRESLANLLECLLVATLTCELNVGTGINV